MNLTITSPWEVIEEKTKQHFAGCLIFSEPKDSSIKWHLYLKDGKLIYATSSLGQQERLTSLWQQFQPDSSVPKFQITSEQEEYEQLCAYWQEKHLPQPQFTQFIAYLIQEALIQILSFKETSVAFFPNSPLPNSPALFFWDELIDKKEQKITDWQELHSYFNSPLNRLYLTKAKSFEFYKLWKKLKTDLENITSQESSKISFWIEALSNKECLYQLAAKLKINPLLIAQKLKPCLDENLIDILPFQELEYQSFKMSSNQTDKFTKEQLVNSPVIACIDDSKTVQRQVKMTLESVGYKVIEITDPTNAFKELALQQPVMILMDITMPKINGYDLCSALRRSQKFRDIPIVMLTGREGFVDRVRAKFVGATDYLTKPFLPQQLIGTVQKMVQASSSGS